MRGKTGATSLTRRFGPSFRVQLLCEAVPALTDLFVRKIKHSGKPGGDKHSDGRALYLLVKSSDKYWRMNYRFEGKHRTLALGAYPDVSLAQARELCGDARKLLRNGVDPNQVKTSAPVEQPEVDPNTFEALALQ